MTPDETFMRLALAQAALSMAEDTLPVGCVIVENGRVIAQNRKRRDGHISLDHAEIATLRDAVQPPRTKADGLTLYTTLEPCAMCFGAIAHNRVARVVYALEDPHGGATKTDLRHIRKYEHGMAEIVGGVLRDETLALFKKFFQQTQNPYWREHEEDDLVRLCRE